MKLKSNYQTVKYNRSKSKAFKDVKEGNALLISLDLKSCKVSHNHKVTLSIKEFNGVKGTFIRETSTTLETLNRILESGTLVLYSIFEQAYEEA